MPGEPGDIAGGLFGPIVTTDALLAATSDRAWVQAMLDAERALVWAEETLGVVPPGSAASIERSCDAGLFDVDALGRAARMGGNPVIPLVGELRVRVGDPGAEWVHWGATSQDILDTASMLVASRATSLIDADLSGLAEACAELSERHRSTLMVGRTLLQHALPITFGLKAAGWLAATTEGRFALRLVRRRLPVQLGGAAGTLASLGDRGTEVIGEMAASLELLAPPLPWHADRIIVAELASMLGLVAGVGSKIAWDVALMMQTEVAEAFEPPAPGRGGSSTLPHKRNPVAAAAVSSAHRQASALVSVILGAMANEHERALGGWQAEWETLTSLLRLAGGVAANVRETLTGLEVDTAAMSENLGLTGGVLLSERIALALSPAIGRAEATEVVQQAAARCRASGRSFADELLDEPSVNAHLSSSEVAGLLDPRGYLGSTEAFVDRALAAYRNG
ncbi:MAG TPA: 3-carboxy-cis,cis-muconate cycloisomerase [Acidimicrobiales bacterium]|nr:3-carboxy-cis,cis-muconate cycloisomerase [Acidimicrobiales bacterium]